jgi:PAS domain S-box-containing protein
MKIKTQVSISLIVFIILAVVIVFSFFSSNNQLQEIQKKQQIIDSIETSAFELYYLENDYIVHGGTRTIERWNAKYALLTGQLQELTLTDPSQQTVLKGMVNSHRDLNTSFSNLVAVTGAVQEKEPPGTSQEFRDFFASTLAGQTQTLMAKSSELSQLVNAEARDVEQRTMLIILFSLAGLMVFVLLNYLIINRSVLSSISVLQKGARQIGTGDLETKIETGSSDELGDLSSAITAMASSLKTVLTTKSELEKEVAERKRTEEQLKESETRYREFFTTSRDCVFITSPDGRFIDFNDATLEMFGYDNREEMSNVSIPSLYAHSEDRSRFLNLIVRDGYVKEFPAQLKRRDGTVIDSLITGVPLRNPDGTIKVLIGTARDITDRKQAEEKLKVSEELYRALVETTGTGYVIIDKDGKVLDANTEYVRLTGHHTLEEILGRSVIEWTAGYEKEKNEVAVKKCARDGYIRNLEIDYIDSTGKVIPVEITATLIEIEGTLRILTLCRDITDRKQLEEALKESEERFRGITERISDLIIILDPEGYATFVSPSITSILGFPPKSYIGKRAGPDIIWAEDVVKIGQVMERLKNGSPGEQIEFRMLKSDGSYAVIDGKGIPVFNQGIYTGVQVVARDITKRKQVEEALQESERKFHTMADFTVDWEYWLAPDSSFVYISPSCEGITGHSPKEFIADPALITRIVHPDDTPLVSDHFSRIHKSPEPGILDFRIVGRDGEIHWLAHTCLPVYDRSGTYLGRRASNRDITDRKRAEEEIQQLNATLEQRVRDRTQELEQATGTIRASLDEKVVMLREIHHRVRNNLQIILSLISLQSRNIKDQKLLDTMGEFRNRIMAMAHVHERMYRAGDFSRIDLSEIVTFLGANLFASYKVNPQHIRLNVDIKDLQINMDTAIPLSLIINELISNSIRHAFPQGTTGEITIAGRREANNVVLSFRDTGIGIPKELDWMRTDQTLGLKLVVGLVQQLNGTINLDRSVGTMFTIVAKEKE